MDDESISEYETPDDVRRDCLNCIGAIQRQTCELDLESLWIVREILMDASEEITRLNTLRFDTYSTNH